MIRFPHPRLLQTGVVTLVTVAAGSIVSAQTPATWKGRTFTKVIAKGDPIPGAGGALFGDISSFTLRDGTVHVVAGESSNKKGLFRWRNGTLSKLVYTDTMSPTGSPFDTVHFTTDETEGALNFFGEVFFGRPGFVYGLFEWRNGVITKVFDTSAPVAGKILNGFGYPVRAGHEVVGSAQFIEQGVRKTGILRWDGSTLKTVIQTGDDLPGSLGGFTGQPGQFQVAFDGQNVGFVATDDPQGRGPAGIYRAAPDGTLTKLIDGNDPFPGGGTYAGVGITFVNVDLEGPNTFLGVGQVVSAGGGNSFYGSNARYTGGTIDIANSVFGTDGKFESVFSSKMTFGGKKWTNIAAIDGQGDDVAVWLRLEDGTQAIYAAVGGGTVVTPTEVKLGAVTSLGGGPLSFSLPTQTGVTYILESKTSLNDATWTVVQTITGDGSEKKLQAALAGITGFFRVRIP